MAAEQYVTLSVNGTSDKPEGVFARGYTAKQKALGFEAKISFAQGRHAV